MAESGHHDGAYWTARYEAEYGAPGRRVPPTPKEGDQMRTCTSTNRNNEPCQSHVVEGSDRCRYHKRAEVEVRRSDEGGDAALKGLILSCFKNRKPIQLAHATVGTGPDNGKLKFQPWRYVDAINPRKVDYGIQMSGRPRPISSLTIFGARARVY